MSCQQSKRAKEEHGLLADPIHSCKASLPPFNVRQELNWTQGPGLVGFNVPVFGLEIPGAIMKLLALSEVRQLAAEMRVAIPQYTVDSFVQNKARVKARAIVEVAKQRADCTSGENAEAVAKLEGFLDAFEVVSAADIQGIDEWMDFVGKYAAPGWQDRLHFDHLLGNFGFTAQTARELQRHRYESTNGKGETEVQELEQYGLRWLSKAMVGYAPKGCLTDVANLVVAMMSEVMPELAAAKPPVELVVRSLAEFTRRLSARDFAGVWVPTLLQHDAEVDDMLCWLLLEHVHRSLPAAHEAAGGRLRVLVQLPAADAIDDDGRADKVRVMEAALSEREGVSTFRDPDSGNVQPLLLNGWPTPAP